MNLLSVPYDESQGNNTWWFHTLSDGRKFVVTRCPNGHTGSLSDHSIAPDGTVSPSVVCQREGCNFHEFIKLADFEKHAE